MKNPVEGHSCPGPCDGLIGPGETLDDLRSGDLRIIQGKSGYRFSLDPILLCGFARVKTGESVADLGTGSGVIPLLLARRTGASSILGVEIHPVLADRARRSVRLNGLEDRIEILEKDIRDLRGTLPPQSFGVVLANPPYRPGGTGRLAPEAERAQGRHELAGGLEDFLDAAAFLLKHGGRFSIVFLSERLAELLEKLRGVGLEPKRLRTVHSRLHEKARLVLVEARRGGRTGMTIEPPLAVYDGEAYSREVLNLYG